APRGGDTDRSAAETAGVAAPGPEVRHGDLGQGPVEETKGLRARLRAGLPGARRPRRAGHGLGLVSRRRANARGRRSGEAPGRVRPDRRTLLAAGPAGRATVRLAACPPRWPGPGRQRPARVVGPGAADPVGTLADHAPPGPATGEPAAGAAGGS